MFFELLVHANCLVKLRSEIHRLDLNLRSSYVSVITQQSGIILIAVLTVVVYRTERTREQLVTELARGTNLLLWLGIIATSISAGVLGYAVFKYVHYMLSLLIVFLENGSVGVFVFSISQQMLD